MVNDDLGHVIQGQPRSKVNFCENADSARHDRLQSFLYGVNWPGNMHGDLPWAKVGHERQRSTKVKLGHHWLCVKLRKIVCVYADAKTNQEYDHVRRVILGHVMSVMSCQGQHRSCHVMWGQNVIKNIRNYICKLNILQNCHNFIWVCEWPDMTYVDLGLTLTWTWHVSDLRTMLTWYLIVTVRFIVIKQRQSVIFHVFVLRTPTLNRTPHFDPPLLLKLWTDFLETTFIRCANEFL